MTVNVLIFNSEETAWNYKVILKYSKWVGFDLEDVF